MNCLNCLNQKTELCTVCEKHKCFYNAKTNITVDILNKADLDFETKVFVLMMEIEKLTSSCSDRIVQINKAIRVLIEEKENGTDA